MPERRLYKNAPIVEAVIDIQVWFASGQQGCATPEAAGAFGDLFPRRQPISTMQMGFSTKNGKVEPIAPAAETVGWRLSNNEESRVLQIQMQRFTYSHLRPYTQWETFSGEAESLWKRYLSVCGPARVTRVAVRYINLLELPGGRISLEDYLNVYPHVPATMEPLDGLLMQMRGKLQEVPDGGRFVATLAPPQSVKDPSTTPFLLDLDVFCERSFQPDDVELWTVLRKLRDAKNRLFEAALTDRMRELIS